MSTIDIEELDDEHEQRRDFRRANGAPLVSDPENPDKTLRYSRKSQYSKCLDDEEALVNWRIWKAMSGVARSKALAAEVNATKDEDRDQKKELRNKALDKGTANEAADMGTALHAMTARWEDRSDVAFDPPEQYVPDLQAYSDALEHYGLVSEMVEVQLVADEFRAAGTADRIYRLTKRLQAPNGAILEPGSLIVGDLKTGAKLDFSLPNYCVQAALYSAGVLYDIHTERRLPTPPWNRDWALLMHLPVGKAHCDVLWSSIELGIYGAWLSKEVKEWRRKWKNGDHDCPAVPDPVEQPDLSSALDATVIASVSLAEMTDFCRRRIHTIGENPAAKDTLILRWPSDLPTPKQGITSDEQLIRMLNLLDKIEAQYSIPFLHPDPRNVLQEGVHATKIDRSNSFALDPT